MLISWTKLLFTLTVNKRKIQNKLKSLFASLILSFRPAVKGASTTDETDATGSPPAPKRCHVDMPTTSSMQYSSLESMGELMDTEDTQQPTDMCHHHKYCLQVIITTRKPMNIQWLPAIQNRT